MLFGTILRLLVTILLRQLVTLESSVAFANLEESYTFNNCAPAAAECNEILQELDRDQVKELLDSILADLFGSDELYTLFGLKGEIEALVQYGVRVQKVCAQCTEFSSSHSCFESFCGDDAYGSAALVSGLLFIPLVQHEEDNKLSILPGLIKGSIWSHTTTASTCNVPSEGWEDFANKQGGNIDVMIPFIVASNGNVAIAPDNLGYGESYNHFKSYLVRQAYKTAAIPLWLKAQQMIADETNCTSEMANNVFLSGYSEGGYGAVAVAEGLECMGVDILMLQGSAGPYQLARSGLEILSKEDQSFRFCVAFLH